MKKEALFCGERRVFHSHHAPHRAHVLRNRFHALLVQLEKAGSDREVVGRFTPAAYS
jgi:hypothetical protein